MSERDIFLAALDKTSPDERAAYLDTACGGDRALRQRIVELLQVHERSSELLRKPLVERLVDGIIATETSADLTPAPVEDHVEGQQLDFLDRSDRPGSIGRLRDYEIEEVIGTGGMGIVLRAADERLRRTVAIKVMTPPLASNEHARRRFVREGRAAAAVRDDHVIGIHHVDATNGLPFLVMEYVVGRSLAQRLEAEGPLPLPDILRIGGQIARGLAAAHAQGVVHRDIKPANILLENGVERVKITDFGLAHAVDDVRTTQPGTVVGTPEYMSPEQARGERVDHRSDLFSLGCVLYAMCAGRPPFRAETTVAIIRRVCEDTPRPLSEINPDIPSWLADIIDKLITKAPDERFQSASEVAELLEQCLAHVQQPCGAGVPPAVSVASSQWPVAKRRGRRSRQWALAAAIVLILGVGLALAESTGVTKLTATVIRIVRGDGTLVVEVDDPNIQVLIDGEEVVVTGAGPKEIRLRPGQHELQTVQDGKPTDTKLVTVMRDGREVIKVSREISTSPPTSTSRLVWNNAPDSSGSVSPDGRYIAVTDWPTGDIAIRDLMNNTTRRLTNQGWPENGTEPIFSRDSKQLAYIWLKNRTYELRVSNLDSTSTRTVYPKSENDAAYPQPLDWSADCSELLCILSTDKPFGAKLVMVNSTTGTTRVLQDDSKWYWKSDVRLSPDGHYVAYSRRASKNHRQRDVFLVSTANGNETTAVQHESDDEFLAWTPDGRGVLFKSERAAEPGLWLQAVSNGQPRGTPKSVRSKLGHVRDMRLTRSGTYFYGIHTGGENVYTAEIDLSGGKLLTPPVEAMQKNIGSNWSPAWSPDGRFLACITTAQPNGFLIRSLETGDVRAVPVNLRNFNIRALQWSPDGKELFVGGPARRIDLETGTIAKFATNENGEDIIRYHPRMSPDGKFIIHQAIGTNRRIFRYNIESATNDQIYQPTEQMRALGLSHDGQIAVAEGNAIKIFPATGGEARELAAGEKPVVALAWTPDSKQLLFARTTGEGTNPFGAPTELWLLTSATSELKKLGDNLPAIDHLRIHPDGNRITFCAHGPDDAKHEIWALENFLPPLDDSKPAATVSASAKPAAPLPPSARLAWADAMDDTGSPSPDGRYFAFVDWDTGDVAVRDLQTGVNRRLTNKGSWDDSSEMALNPRFSADGKTVFYIWFDKDGTGELRSIGIDGGTPRSLYGKDIEGDGYPFMTTPDSRFILVGNYRKEELKIARVNVANGSAEIIKSLDRRPDRKASDPVFSPDCRYMAYTRPAEPGSTQRDVFMQDMESTTETRLTNYAAQKQVLAWAPDSQRLLFKLERPGGWDAWMIRVVDGKPSGPATLVKTDIGHISPFCFARDGAFYYSLKYGGPSLFTAAFDLEKATAAAAPLAEEAFTAVEMLASPQWSSDGEFLAYKAIGQDRTQHVKVRSTKSGASRAVLAMPTFRDQFRLSPSGSSFLTTAGVQGRLYQIRQTDMETGKTSILVGQNAKPGRTTPAWNPDGTGFYYANASGITYRDLQTRTEKQVLPAETLPFDEKVALYIDVAADGKNMAIAGREKSSGLTAIQLLPLSGEGPRELCRLAKGAWVPSLDWTPDGRTVMFSQVDSPGKHDDGLWFVNASGGQPRKLDISGIDNKKIRSFAIHPDGKQLAFAAGGGRKIEVWALENFLPPLDDAKPPAVDPPEANSR
jgi:Tol biopolymer transport system component